MLKTLFYYLQSYILNSRISKHIINNRNITVVKGTIRETTDKDDAWFYEMAKNASIIYDVGANIGYTAILASLANPESKLVLIDPNPEALSIAAKNTMLNKFSQNCVFLSAFISDKDDQTIDFYTVGSGAAGSKYKSHAKTAAKINSHFEVSTLTLDSVFKITNLSPDLVKVDVEGAEIEVLNGANVLASQLEPMFFVEMHSNSELTMYENAKKVILWCESLNYRAFYLKDKVALVNPSLVAHRGRCHLLLIPKNKSFPEYLKSVKQGAEINF